MSRPPRWRNLCRQHPLKGVLSIYAEIESKVTQATEAEKVLETLKRNLDLKKDVLVGFVDQLRDAQTQLSEIERKLSEEGLKHQNLQDERAGLLRVVKQNATEVRATLRRALMELNETRYAVGEISEIESSRNESFPLFNIPQKFNFSHNSSQ